MVTGAIGKPSIEVPAGAVDCHVHVFGGPEYRPAPRRGYTPHPATPDNLCARLDAAGLAGAVLVQPSAYGTDNSCMLDALKGPLGSRFRGVAVIAPEGPRAELDEMHRLGVRGVRLNLVSTGAAGPEQAARLIEAIAARIAPLGWHLQMYADLPLIARHAALIARLPVDSVFDHMGHPHAEGGVGQPGFAALLELLAAGRSWVKISGAYHISPDELGNPDVTGIARALVAANPDRVVWGSDWPHLGKHEPLPDGSPPKAIYRAIDYGALVSVMAEWVPDTAVRARVMAANARRLYGFD